MKQMYKLINNIITHKKNLSSTLIPLLVLFTIISNLIDNNIKEFSFIEIVSNFILFICIFFQIKNRKLFLKLSNRTSFFIRLFACVFLLYEELSFLTNNKSMFFNQISTQNEINFHNLNFMYQNRADITISFLNYSADITLYILS